jgi:hypothetical protein
MNTQDPTPEDERAYTAWVDSCPAIVRVVASRFRPWKLYRMKSTGHRVTVYAFDEDSTGVTLQVAVLAKYNLLVFERMVFGIDPDDLEECALPRSDELVGARMPQEEARAMFARKAAN